jgi:hypothetical protein
MFGQSRRPSPQSQSSRASGSGRGPGGTEIAPSQQSSARGSSPAKEANSGGIGGWFRSAGDWIGDKWSDVKEGVSDAVDTVGEAWEAWKNTDFSYEDGVLSAETDVDELAAILPEGALGGLAFDREAGSENKVKIALDRKAGVARITSDDLRIAGIRNGALSTGPVSLQGVSIEIRNESEGKSSLFDLKDGNTRVSVNVSRVAASAVRWEGPEGPVDVAELELGALRVSGANQGEGLPFGEGRQTQGSFDVGSAVLRGVRGAGTSVEELRATDFGVGIDEAGESAFVGASSVDARGIDGPAGKFGEASVRDIRADVDNRGGGLPMVDATPDRARTRLSVGEASVRGADTASVDARAAKVSGITASHDATTGALDVRAGAAEVQGLDTAAVDAHAARVSDLAFSQSATGGELAMRAGRAEVDGLDTAAVDARSVRLDAVSASSGASGVRASVGAGRAEGVEAGGAQAELIEAKALSGGGQGSNWDARADALGVRGLTSAQGSAQSIDTSKLAVSGSGGGVRGEVAAVDARGLRGDVGSVDRVRLDGASGQVHGDQAAMNVRSAQVEGVETAQASIRSASASELSASRDGDRVLADAQRLGGQGIAVRREGRTELEVDSADIQGAKADIRGRAGQLSGEQIALDGVNATSFQAGRVVATDAGATVGDANLGVRLGQATGEDLVIADRARVARAEVNGVSSNLRGDGARETRIDSAALSGVSDSVSGASLRGASLSGLDVTTQNGGGEATLDRARIDELAANGTSVRAAELQGARASSSARGVSGSVERASASDIAVGERARLAELQATGLSGARTAGGDVSGGVRSVDARGASVRTDTLSADVASASARDLQGGVRGGQTYGSARSAGADGVRFTSEGGQGGESGVDNARLVETATARLDSLDASFSAPVAAGRYDAGPVDLRVQQGTTLSGQVQVRGGEIVGSGTRVEASRAVDGPLWTGVRGAYVEDGQLRGDVSGWFDPNLSKGINEGMGLRGDRLHGIDDYGRAAAAQMRRPAAPSRPSNPSQPGIAEAIDANAAQVQARASLSAGTLDAGVARAELASGPGANTFDVRKSGGNELVVSFAQFLASALSLNVGGQQVQAGASSVSDAQLSVGGSQRNRVTGTVGAVRVEDVGLGRKP